MLSRVSRVSRCSAPIGHPYPIYCRLRSVLRSKTGDRRRALVRGVIASGCSCLFRWRSDQKAAFASGDFIDVRLASRDGGQSKSCCDNPCSVAIARPEPARPDAAIWIPQSCWAGGSLGSLLDGEGPSHAPRHLLFSLSKLLSWYACLLAPFGNNFRNTRGSTRGVKVPSVRTKRDIAKAGISHIPGTPYALIS